MTTASIIAIFLLAFVASLTQRISGFGFGIMMMTVLPFLMPEYKEATALCGLLAFVNAAVTAVKMRKSVAWKKLIPILITFTVVSFFAIIWLKRVDSLSLRHGLGIVMVVVSIYLAFVSGKFRMKPSIPVQASMGTLSGVMGGLFAMQGPPAVVYFISCADSKEEYIALTQWYFMIGNLLMSIFRASHGFVTRSVGCLWLICIPAVLGGLVIGRLIYGKISIQTIRITVYAYMAVCGIVLIIL